MTRSFFRLLPECFTVIAVAFGVWLIQLTLQPSSDAPNLVLLSLGGLDIFIGSILLSYLLRRRLQEGERLPKSWIVAGAVLLAGYLGWITALLSDAERLRAEQHLHQQSARHLIPMEEAVRQFQQILPAAGASVDRKRWDLSHDRYAREYDQLHVLLRAKPIWEPEVTRIHELVQQLRQRITAPHPEARIDAHAQLQQSRDRAEDLIQQLRSEISRTEQMLADLHRARWHSIGTTALTGVFLWLGCMLPWLVFDRELHFHRSAQTRLTENERQARTDLQMALRDHEEYKKFYEAKLRESENRRRYLEKSLHEHEAHCVQFGAGLGQREGS